MDDRLKESISALMDDEANELELQRVLSHLDREELKGAWHSYHRVRDIMRNDGATGSAQGAFEIDVSQSVAEMIDAENLLSETPLMAVESEEQSPDKTSRSAQFGGLWAVAASIAFAVAFVFQNGITDTVDESSVIASSQTQVLNVISSPVTTVALASDSAAEPKIIVQFSEQHARRFNEYLLRHAEHSSMGSSQGFMPLARVASVNSVGI